jgi:hypothetical protein
MDEKKQIIYDKVKQNIFKNESECVQEIILLRNDQYFGSLMGFWIREYIREQIKNNNKLIPSVAKSATSNEWIIKYIDTESIEHIVERSKFFINEWFRKNNINVVLKHHE